MAKPGPKAIDPRVRFWRKVKKGTPDECWLWTGGRSGKGYGQFYLSHGQPVGAHRFSWSIHNAQPVPTGMQVMHSCDNPSCVNPEHLSVGTCADNLRDCAAKGRDPGNRTPGPRPYLRKVDDSTVQRLRADGLTMRQIGDLLDVSASTVLRSLRRGWKR